MHRAFMCWFMAALFAIASCATARAQKPEDLGEKFAVNSIWKGTAKQKQGGKEVSTDVELTVTKRDGKSFEGVYEDDEGANAVEVKGMLIKNAVEWKITKALKKNQDKKPPVGTRFTGTVRRDPKTKAIRLIANYAWANAANPRVVSKGRVELSLEE